MLTPLDIHNKEFKRALRGYDVDEVDEFLDEVIKDFESLYKTNLDQKEQLRKLQENLDRYREMEETLQNTMVLAQKLAEEAKRNAEKEAELIIWEARKKAEQIVSNAYDQVTENSRKLEQIKAYERQMMIKLRSFFTSQLQLLENNDFGTLSFEVEEKKKEPTKNAFMEDNGE